jgi:hypothetical protein
LLTEENNFCVKEDSFFCNQCFFQIGQINIRPRMKIIELSIFFIELIFGNSAENEYLVNVDLIKYLKLIIFNAILANTTKVVIKSKNERFSLQVDTHLINLRAISENLIPNDRTKNMISDFEKRICIKFLENFKEDNKIEECSIALLDDDYKNLISYLFKQMTPDNELSIQI